MQNPFAHFCLQPSTCSNSFRRQLACVRGSRQSISRSAMRSSSRSCSLTTQETEEAEIVIFLMGAGIGKPTSCILEPFFYIQDAIERVGDDILGVDASHQGDDDGRHSYGHYWEDDGGN